MHARCLRSSLHIFTLRLIPVQCSSSVRMAGVATRLYTYYIDGSVSIILLFLCNVSAGTLLRIKYTDMIMLYTHRVTGLRPDYLSEPASKAD